MPVTYAIKKVKNPKGIEGVDYYHGRVIKTGDYNFEDLVEDINNSTTVTKADAMAVLASIKPFISKALINGQVVVLDDLGRFQVTIQGKCYDAARMASEDFSPSAMIKSHRIVFRPDVTLKKTLAQNFRLKRISSEAMA
jgi:predicted histone-like DNA-binding protein